MDFNSIKLKKFQMDALKKLQAHKVVHLLCVSPTGSGKSLIFQKYLKDNPKIKALLISPLNALSLQHYEDFTSYGIQSYLFSAQKKRNSPDPYSTQVWIMSPEKIFQSNTTTTFEMIQKLSPQLLIVDECHCVFEWGQEFRRSFKCVLNLIHELKIKKSIWLTATIEKNDVDSLAKNLEQNFYKLGQYNTAQNLKLIQIKISQPEKLEFLINFVKNKGCHKPGIIFTSSRKSAEKIHSLIQSLNYDCTYFHAGMSLEEKQIIYKKLNNNEIKILIATTAFGMGMNYKYFEWAIVYSPLYSISQIAQALGRIGRNTSTQEALGIILWDENDFYHLHAPVLENDKNHYFQSKIIELYFFLKDTRYNVNEKLLHHFNGAVDFSNNPRHHQYRDEYYQ